MLDTGDLADMNHPLVVLDDPVQVRDTHVLVFLRIRNHGPGCRKRFLPGIQEPVFHVDPDLVAGFQLFCRDRSPDRDLLDDIAPDVPGVRFE